MITDSQVHIWEVDRPNRPWPQPPRNEPQLPNGYTAEEMIAEMERAGVDRAVIVPPTWVGESNETALDTARAYPLRFAIMGRIDIKRPDLKEAMATWKQQPGMLGVRHTFRTEPYRTWLESGKYEPFWDAAEEYGIPVMCLVSGFPAVLSILGPIAVKHPGLTLIVDHMACALNQKGAAAFETINDLVALAKYPNVLVKVSSAPCFSAEPYPFNDINPFIRRICEAYGAQRLMWGADRTRLTSTYEECVRHFSEGLGFLSATDREWILGRTLATVLHWPEE
jgi:predicted TIM-barrel fold metal-dependent hydrolase